MGCDGDCKCGDKESKEGTFDRLAELERFMEGDLTIEDRMPKLPKPWIIRSGLEKATKLQFCGWAISLNSNGTWYVEDTSGG